MVFRSYADFVKSRGETVRELGGVSWMKFRGALIPASSMPVYPELSEGEAENLVKATAGLFLRYTSRPRQRETRWWYMVCRQYSLDRVSANTRSKVRRGLRYLTIARASPEWLMDHGYQCHRRSYQRYKHATPLTEDEFRSFISGMAGQPIFEIWVCHHEQELLGYIICVREENGVFMYTIDITPEGLHHYAAYAMIHTLLETYLNGQGLPITNGSRSISHATDMQDFLLKLGFAREFAELHVVYRPDIRVIVNLLYPFRKIFGWLKALPLINSISSVLFQEEIQRNQYSTWR